MSIFMLFVMSMRKVHVLGFIPCSKTSCDRWVQFYNNFWSPDYNNRGSTSLVSKHCHLRI